MIAESIHVQGAREHNLRNIDIRLPKDKLIVFTGVSGSGKSSLAIDTVYAEGQRRYIESLSAYARQFLGQLGKPDVDEIVGLSPSIAINQGSTGHNPRSTVATVTEIYDYLRVFYARVGRFTAPNADVKSVHKPLQTSLQHCSDYPPRTRLIVLAPFVRGSRGAHEKEIEDYEVRVSRGYVLTAKSTNSVRALPSAAISVTISTLLSTGLSSKMGLNRASPKPSIPPSLAERGVCSSRSSRLKAKTRHSCQKRTIYCSARITPVHTVGLVS